ncbi:MAG: hypothetical protein Q9227_001297 [Pyrenula ochraceoflavens]
MAKVQGTCDGRFKAVEQLLQSYIDSGEELGASIVVNIDGEDVVDLWGGYADQSHSRLWERDTITTIWSSTKTVTSLAALILIDRGLLSPQEKVSKYWPEFAANGKQDVEVRHFLSHSSGVAGWDKKLTKDIAYNLPRATAMLAEQAPWWTPGTASGYHVFAMGYLVGELVRRTTGKSLRQFIAEEIATPLGADFQLGAAEKDWPRISNVIPPPPPEDLPPDFDPSSVMGKVLTNPAETGDATIGHTADFRRAELGASNGHSNARGLARALSAIPLGGQVGNTQLLSPKTIDLIFQEQTNGKDLVLGEPIRFGIGYALTGKDTMLDWLPDRRICLWAGWGGSLGLMDVDKRMTIAYVMNKMSNAGVGDHRVKTYVGAIYKALESSPSA